LTLVAALAGVLGFGTFTWVLSLLAALAWVLGFVSALAWVLSLGTLAWVLGFASALAWVLSLGTLTWVLGFASALAWVLSLGTLGIATLATSSLGAAVAKAAEAVLQVAQTALGIVAKSSEFILKATKETQVPTALGALASSGSLVAAKLVAETATEAAQFAFEAGKEIATIGTALTGSGFAGFVSGSFVGGGLMIRACHPSRSEKQDRSFHG